MNIPRRSLLAAGPLALAGCGRSDAVYFGNAAPPSVQQLVFETEAEPTTLDPAQTQNGPGEQYILPALFEGLTAFHPVTSEPMAALATHYEVSPDGTRYRFFLRGHPNPHGTRLPDTGDLPIEYTRGRKAVSNRKHARWSDGRPITAHDFVYSWRRAIAPDTAAPYANLLFDLKNGEDINTRKRSPNQLGVRAADNFTLEVDLASPAPYLLHLSAFHFLSAVPRHAIEAAGPSWTNQRHIVTSGPFTVAEWRPRDLVRVVKNPYYYDAEHVALDEIRFVPFSDSSMLLHYYEAGDAQWTSHVASPLMSVLKGKRDCRTHPMFGLESCTFNVGKPPFNEPLVRYAFNMAVDKGAMANWRGMGQTPARTMVPPLQAYESPRSLLVNVNGKSYDVLAFDPAGARELLRAAGFDFEQTIEFLTTTISISLAQAEILRAQWNKHLGVKVQVAPREFGVFADAITALTYKGIAAYWNYGVYTDPYWFLSSYRTAAANTSGWTDSQYTAMLREANALADPAERMSKLAQCEKYVLTAMPMIPLWYDTWSYFQKPYLRGCGGNLVDSRQFKYAWIDSNWRPQ